MTFAAKFVLLLWLVFAVYWMISAFSAKRQIRGPRWWQQAAVRLLLVVCYLVAVRGNLLHRLGIAPGLPVQSPIESGVGALLCVIGFAFAVWARTCIGTNWGMPMSLNSDPELVTSGPYSLVRHPIYSGILLAMIGFGLVFGPFVFFLLAITGIYFLYSARVEEGLMADRFPDKYPRYKQRTKMLIPYIL